jgi:hypothetical protein
MLASTPAAAPAATPVTMSTGPRIGLFTPGGCQIGYVEDHTGCHQIEPCFGCEIT